MINLKSLHKSYKTGATSLHVLKGINLDIEKGELLTNENLGLKRPGYGLPPKLIDKILGKYSTKKILKGQLLKEDDYK